MKKLAVFDLEVLPNVFLACIKPLNEEIITIEISPRKNQIKELIALFESKQYIFVGYNCSGYDTPIINMLIADKYKFMYGNYLQTTDAAFKLSGCIINNKDKNKPCIEVKPYLYSKYFPQIDLMTLMASKALRVSLKALQVTMCYHNVKEMIVDWTKYLRKEEIDPIIYYCHNDVNSTTELLSLLKTDLNLRKLVRDEFGIECFSKDGVGVGVDLFTKFICENMKLYEPKQLFKYVDVDNIIAIKELILPDVKFKTPVFQNLLKWYQNIVVNLTDFEELTDAEKEEKYKFSIFVNNMGHMYGLGGMHSMNKPAIYTADKEFYYSDRDVASYYPAMCIEKRFGPRGFLQPFIVTMIRIREGRLIAKKAKNKVKDTAFKLAMNSILGNLRNKFSPFYDPAANMAIAINGQLYLSMLIEECELNGIECVSSNTDGATFKVRRKDKELYDKICDEWQAKTQMVLEEVLYEKMVVLAVNDYIAFKEGYSKVKDQIKFFTPEESIHFNFVELKLIGNEINQIRNDYVKEKGVFITVPRLTKGMDSLIISKALQNYFGRGIPIEETITDFKSIHDYVKMEKVGRQFHVEWNGVSQQHINRFVVGNSSSPYLRKWKMVQAKEKVNGKMVPAINKTTKEPIMEKSYSNVLKGFGVTLVNEYENGGKDVKINYKYYIDKTRKIIERLQPPITQTTLF